MPALHAACSMLLECLTSSCSHGRVQSGCLAIRVTSTLPLTGVGRLRVDVIVRCVLCVHKEGVPVDVGFAGCNSCNS